MDHPIHCSCCPLPGPPRPGGGPVTPPPPTEPRPPRPKCPPVAVEVLNVLLPPPTEAAAREMEGESVDGGREGAMLPSRERRPRESAPLLARICGSELILD